MIAIAWVALPRAGQRIKESWWQVPSCTLVFRVDGQTVVPVDDAVWPTRSADGIYIAQVFFERHEEDSPPGFGWLWGEAIVGIEPRLGQWVMAGEWSAEALPRDGRDQLGTIIERRIAEGRYSDMMPEHPTDRDRVRRYALPVRVGLAHNEHTEPIPGATWELPAWRLWAVSVLTAGGFACIAIGLACLIRAFGWRWRARRRRHAGACAACGYEVRDLPRCPECGETSDGPAHGQPAL